MTWLYAERSWAGPAVGDKPSGQGGAAATQRLFLVERLKKAGRSRPAPPRSVDGGQDGLRLGVLDCELPQLVKPVREHLDRLELER